MAYKTNLEMMINRCAKPEQKIIINTGPNPQQLYFANRKGWLINEPVNITKSGLDSISSHSHSIAVLDKKINTTFNKTDFDILSEDDNYYILKPK